MSDKHIFIVTNIRISVHYVDTNFPGVTAPWPGGVLYKWAAYEMPFFFFTDMHRCGMNTNVEHMSDFGMSDVGTPTTRIVNIHAISYNVQSVITDNRYLPINWSR